MGACGYVCVCVCCARSSAIALCAAVSKQRVRDDAGDVKLAASLRGAEQEHVRHFGLLF